jgi:hypothetical protein
MKHEYIAPEVTAELHRLPSFEEDADVGDQNADAMRWHATALRGRARYNEDKGDQGVVISIRWARVLAKALMQGADAKELFDA